MRDARKKNTETKSDKAPIKGRKGSAGRVVQEEISTQ